MECGCATDARRGFCAGVVLQPLLGSRRRDLRRSGWISRGSAKVGVDEVATCLGTCAREGERLVWRAVSGVGRQRSVFGVVKAGSQLPLSEADALCAILGLFASARC